MAITQLQPFNLNSSSTYTFGNVSSTGNVIVAGVVTATGNVTGANVVTTGNISGGNISVSGNIAASNFVAPVIITTITYPGDDTAADTAGGQTITITGSGFVAGASVIINGSAVGVVSVVSSTTITFTSPAQSSGSYPLYIVNTNGTTGVAVPGIQYSGTPTWTTAAGSLGSYTETVAIANTVTATGDAPITYSLYSGTLPTGATLNTSNGYISGTSPLEASPTTFTFTIRATDAQKQDTDRQFSLTINPDVVTWSSPANGTTYTNAANSAISNVTMSASAASGQTITYTANALPTGLSISGANITGTPTVSANSSSLLTATAATTNATATRTINWVISVANDGFWPYVSLLLSANTPNSTFVADASTNNFAITVNGDTKPNNFNPYTPGYYSNYFDGTGDYLTVADNAALQMGSGDFTIEFWINFSSISGYQTAFDKGYTNAGGLLIQTGNGNGRFIIYANGSAVITESGTASTNVWINYALVRSGTTLTLYRDGNSSGSVTNSVNFNNSTVVAIGANGGSGGGAPAGTSPFNGYISNFRIVKGTAVYTSAFTPPTSPLSAITNTSLLTCQSNRFIDNSTNNFTITKNGDTTVSGFIPYTPNSSYSTYGSGYFDGTGDYLTTASNAWTQLSTGNFTVESFVYIISYGTYFPVIDARNTAVLEQWLFGVNSSGFADFYGGPSMTRLTDNVAVGLNAWIHLAAVRNGSTVTLYVNGVSKATTTFSSAINGAGSSPSIGRLLDPYYANGYISNVRVVIGTAVYTTAFTPPSSPLTAVSNTQLLTLQNNQPINNNTFIDNSTNNFLVTRTGNATQGSFSPYAGTWSNYFSATGDNLRVGTTTALGVSFTLECWIFPTSFANYRLIWDNRTSDPDTVGFAFGLDGNAKVYIYTNNLFQLTTTTALSANTWTHLALVRNGSGSSNLKIYINGVADATTGTYATSFTRTAVYIGNDFDGTGAPFNGYISNLRTSTSALYTTTFTPSTTPLVPETYTNLLTCQSNRLVDNSINNSSITVSGSYVQKFSPFTMQTATVPTSYSGYFDGSGDYLDPGSQSAFAFGTGDFTVECWIYATTASDSPIYEGRANGSTSDGFTLTAFSSSVIRIYSGSALISSSGTTYLNQWTHVAVCRVSSTTTLYINGVSAGTSASLGNNTTASALIGGGRYTGSVSVSNFFTGYISNFRIVKGTAVYTGNFTPSTSPLTAIANSSLLTLQSTTFIDNSTNNFTITAYGDSKPTIQNPFGYTNPSAAAYTTSSLGGSMYFDGSGDYITMTTNAPTLSGDFTVELWYYLSGALGADVYLFDGPSTGNKFCFELISGNIKFIYNGSSVLTATFTPTQGQWYHIALSRSGTLLVFYINGISIGSTTYGGQIAVPATFNIGAAPTFSLYVTGYISSLRITNGTAVYSSNFVPPYLSPLLAIKNTALLANGTSAGIYDSSMSVNLETVGDAKINTSTVKFTGKTSMYFDGTGDYLSTLPNQGLNFGTGDFTIEAWVYITNTAGDWFIISATGTGGMFFGYTNTTTVGWGYGRTGTAWDYKSGGTVTANSWTFIAMTRNGTSIRMFSNGTQIGTTQTSSQAYDLSTTSTTVGSQGATYYLSGYISDLRITKGYARYTANFTAPTTPFLQY